MQRRDIFAGVLPSKSPSGYSLKRRAAALNRRACDSIAKRGKPYCPYRCEERGFSVVREYTGHGVGTHLHEDPSVPNYGTAGRGQRLLPGMTIAIEPMINAGSKAVKCLPDGWTVKTLDGKLSAHFEHTIAITKGEPIILTKL